MIYLNNAATSYPKPGTVLSAVQHYLSSAPYNAQRSVDETQKEDVISACRENIRKFFNIKHSHNIFFTSGATESLNLAIKGLPYNNYHIITTNTEHNSVYRPLMHQKQKNILDFSCVECNEQGLIDPDDIRNHMTESTRAVIINHCSNVTGIIQDIKKISDICNKYQCLLIVDASQSAGSVPIDVQAMGIDILIFTGHKSLFAMQGIGGIYIKEEVDIEPLKTGGTGTRSDLLVQPGERPVYYEAGTQNIPGIVSLNEGIKFILSTGLSTIWQHKHALLKKIIKYFDTNKYVIHYAAHASNKESIISFNIINQDPADIGYILEKSYDIQIRSGLHCAPMIHKALGSYPNGSIRASLSYFNRDSEINTFISAIEEITKTL